MVTASLRERAEQWIDDDPDPRTQDELRALLASGEEASAELGDRFAAALEFGTAGLRGVLAAGPNRMNRAVVRRATWGFAQELLAGVPGAKQRGVVVGGDARRMSSDLAQDTAAVLAAAGLPAVLFEEPVPTPVVAFAVRHLGACGGVVVTASHNPPEYSGYKVYWENGAQIVPPIEGRIAAAMARAPAARAVLRPSLEELRARGLVRAAPAELSRAYLDAVRRLAAGAGGATVGDRSLRIVYTPLHGVGDGWLRPALSEAGFADVESVPEQRKPDGAFPTVAFPNPEEPGAMDLALALAGQTRASLVLANDPDADRLAVAVARRRPGEGFRQLTGNELGALMGHYLLTERPVTRPRAVLASIVSSPLLGRIAVSLGVRYEETLTGFKWIAHRAIELEQAGYEFVFGYEEALGYCVGSAVRDKDGICAAAVVAEMAAVLRSRGQTFEDQLDDIARRWGFFASAQRTLVRKGAAGLAEIAQIMDRLRASPPAQIGDYPVVAVADYAARRRTEVSSASWAPLELPASNVLVFELAPSAARPEAREARIVARPSGTEPKAKFYFDLREEVRPGEPVSVAAERAKGAISHLTRAFASLA